MVTIQAEKDKLTQEMNSKESDFASSLSQLLHLCNKSLERVARNWKEREAQKQRVEVERLTMSASAEEARSKVLEEMDRVRNECEDRIKVIREELAAEQKWKSCSWSIILFWRLVKLILSREYMS